MLNTIRNTATTIVAKAIDSALSRAISRTPSVNTHLDYATLGYPDDSDLSYFNKKNRHFKDSLNDSCLVATLVLMVSIHSNEKSTPWYYAGTCGYGCIGIGDISFPVTNVEGCISQMQEMLSNLTLSGSGGILFEKRYHLRSSSKHVSTRCSGSSLHRLLTSIFGNIQPE